MISIFSFLFHLFLIIGNVISGAYHLHCSVIFLYFLPYFLSSSQEVLLTHSMDIYILWIFNFLDMDLVHSISCAYEGKNCFSFFTFWYIWNVFLKSFSFFFLPFFNKIYDMEISQWSLQINSPAAATLSASSKEFKWIFFSSSLSHFYSFHKKKKTLFLD